MTPTPEQIRKKHTLTNVAADDGREYTAPRYSTKSLSDDDLVNEIETAPVGPWLDALVHEAARRGLEA